MENDRMEQKAAKKMESDRWKEASGKSSLGPCQVCDPSTCSVEDLSSILSEGQIETVPEGKSFAVLVDSIRFERS
jgi:hypothetical protein